MCKCLSLNFYSSLYWKKKSPEKKILIQSQEEFKMMRSLKKLMMHLIDSILMSFTSHEYFIYIMNNQRRLYENHAYASCMKIVDSFFFCWNKCGSFKEDMTKMIFIINW